MSSPSFIGLTHIKSAALCYQPEFSAQPATTDSTEGITPTDPLEPEFFLDGLSWEFKELLDENGWLRNDAILPQIPHLPESSIKLAQDLLNTPKIFKIPHPKGHFEVKLTLKMILNFLSSQKDISLEIKNQIVGGFLQKLLGSQWLIESIRKLIGEEKVKKWINSESLQHIDKKKCDIDLRHIRIKKENTIQSPIQIPLQNATENASHNLNDPGVLAESFVVFVSGKIPKNNFNYTQEQLCNFIRCEGSIFKEFHSLFWIDPKPISKVENNLFLLAFSDFAGMDIDLIIATVLEKIVLVTTQDFSLDIDPLLSDGVHIQGLKITPQGKLHGGWQAILDIVCKVVHFQSLTCKALVKAASLMTKQFRCGGPFPQELFEDLWRYCKKSGRPAATAIAHLLKSEIRQHHANDSNASVALVYNLCSVLLQNGFASDTLTDVWKEMNKHTLKGPIQNPTPSTSQFLAIKQAAELLPFDFVAALLDIRKFMAWSCHPQGQTENIYLRQHASKLHLMAVSEDLSLYSCCNPDQALMTIIKYCRQLSLQEMEAARLFLNALMPANPYNFDQPLSQKCKKHLKINLLSLEYNSKLLIEMPQKEFKMLGWEILTLKEFLDNGPRSFAHFIESLPEMISCDANSQFQQSIWNCLHFLCNKNEIGGTAFQQILSKLKALINDKRLPKSQLYEFWLLELTASKNRNLCESAYKIWSSYLKNCKITDDSKFYQKIISNLIPLYPEYALRICLDLIKVNCTLLTGQSALFEAVAQAFASVFHDRSCRLDVTLLASFADELMHKNLLDKKSASDLFATICKDLLSVAVQDGYKLLSYASRETKLFAQDPSNASTLWLLCCDAYFPIVPVMHVYHLWQEAAELKVWKPTADFKEHKAFITAFIEKLYALENADADSLGHHLLTCLSNAPYKDGLSSKIECLCVLREKKLLKDKQTQEELVLSQKQLETFLTAPAKASKTDDLKAMSKDLIDKLCKKIPDPSTHSENLWKAKKLLENPKVHRLFEEAEELRGMLIGLLDLTFHSKTARLANNATLTLLETFFATLPEDFSMPCTPPVLSFSKYLVQILNRPGRNFSHKFQVEVDRRQIAIMNLFNSFKMPQWQCLFFKGLIQNDFKIFLNHSTFHEYLLFPVLQLLETSPAKTEDVALVKECLVLIEQKRGLAHEVIQNSYIESYIALVNQLMHHEILVEAMPWINRILELDAGNQNSLIPQLFLNWGMLLGQKKYFALTMKLFKEAQVHNGQLLEQIVEAVLNLPEEALDCQPNSYIQFMLDGQKSVSKPAAYERISKKIHFIVQRFINAGITTANSQLIIHFYEPLPKPPTLPFAPLLKAISEMKNRSLKIRFSDSFQRHTAILKCQPADQDSNDLWEDWLKGWEPSLKILQDLWSETKDAKYKNSIFNELDLILDKKSAASSFWREHTYEEMQAKTISKLIFICLSMVNNSNEDQNLLLQLIKGLDIIKNQKQELDACQKIRLSLIEKISNTANRTLFLYGCMSIDLLFREGNATNFKPIFAQLCEYVKHSKQFDSNGHDDIFASLNYILEHVNESLIDRHDMMRIVKAAIPISDRLPSADRFIIYAKCYYDENIFGNAPPPRRFRAKQLNITRQFAFMGILFLYLANQFYYRRLDLKDLGIALGASVLIWSGLLNRKF